MFVNQSAMNETGIGRPEPVARPDFSDRLQDVGRELCETEELLINLIQIVDGGRPEKVKVESPANHYEAIKLLDTLAFNVRTLSSILYDLLK